MNDIIFTSAITASKFKANNLEWKLSFQHNANKFAIIRGNEDYFQDLGNTSLSGNLRFTFVAESADEKAFFEAIKESGAATISQPDRDKVLNIQPLSISKTLKLTKDITRVIFDISFVTTRLPGAVESKNTLYNALLENNVETVATSGENLSEYQKLKTAFDESRQIENFAKSLEAASRALGVKAADLDASLSDIVNDPIRAMFAFNELISQPAILFDRIANKINGYQNLITDLLTINFIPGQTAIQKSNDLLFAEAAVGVTTAAMLDASINASYLTSNDVIETTKQLILNTQANRDLLDDYQEDGFFQQSGAMQQQLNRYISGTTSFLFSLAFGLQTEFRFVVETPITVFEIGAEYYPEKMFEDEIGALDFIIDTNKLINDELLEIPHGREILVYV